jgi:hypothetical protein
MAEEWAGKAIWCAESLITLRSGAPTPKGGWANIIL